MSGEVWQEREELVLRVMRDIAEESAETKRTGIIRVFQMYSRVTPQREGRGARDERHAHYPALEYRDLLKTLSRLEAIQKVQRRRLPSGRAVKHRDYIAPVLQAESEVA